MGGFNLPDGCLDCHIPGFRPEDVRREEIERDLFDEWCGHFPAEECGGCEVACRQHDAFYQDRCPAFDAEADERMRDE